MGKQHIIELNGKRYDALTGTPVTNLPTGVAKAKALGKAIDGFRPVPQPARTVQKVSPPLKAPQKSKTLMRSSVRKPAPTVKPTTVVDGIVSHQATLPPDRLARAVSTPRSKLVRKFYDGIVSQGRSTPAVAAFKESTSATEAETDADPLQHQVDAAQSHTAPKLKKTRLSAKVAKRLRVKPRVVSAGTMALAAILLVGFFAFQNIPNLSMRLASSRAGIHGSLPSYQPSGFALAGGIAYSPGQITVAYKSNSDNRNFKIIQKTSQWDSQSLLDNYVAVNHQSFQTVQDKGKTVYIYDGSNASWVDSGIWYRVEGDSSLNSDQLLNLAASL